MPYDKFIAALNAHAVRGTWSTGTILTIDGGWLA